jgi:putative colanic acid biosysnthesis UDP-glucose lipid carrier transferase
MLALLDRQTSLLRTQLSLSSLLGAFIDPAIIVVTLFATARSHGEVVDAHYVVLGLIAFSLSFPGRGRFRDRPGKIARGFFCSSAMPAAT